MFVVVGSVVSYVLWKLGVMLKALVSILVKAYKEEAAAEASKHQETKKEEAKRSNEERDAPSCTDGVCMLPQKSKAS